MVKVDIVLFPTLVPALFNVNSPEHEIMIESQAKEIIFHITYNFIDKIDEFFNLQIKKRTYTKEKANFDKEQLLSKIKLHSNDFYKFVRNTIKMGINPQHSNEFALNLFLPNSFIWMEQILPEYEKLGNQVKIITTKDFRNTFMNLFNVFQNQQSTSIYQPILPEIHEMEPKNKEVKPADKEIHSDEKSITKKSRNIDPKYLDIQSVSEPAGFYPGFVKWAVEKFGFQDAETPNKAILLNELPDESILEKIQFFGIYDPHEEKQIAEMEIIDFEQQSPAIPYWGLIVSLEKRIYKGSVIKEYEAHTFFRNLLPLQGYKIQNYKYIYGPRGEFFKEQSENWIDSEKLKKNFGISLGELHVGDAYNFIRIIFKDKKNQVVSKTLGLQRLVKECKIKEWANKIASLSMPPKDSKKNEKEGI